MYNDNNLQSERRRAMMRQSIPTGVRSDIGDQAPLLDEKIGGRRCDGTMPGKMPDRDRGDSSWGLREYPLAMVYSPYQVFRETYTPDTALQRGTLFSELDLPFEGHKLGG